MWLQKLDVAVLLVLVVVPVVCVAVDFLPVEVKFGLLSRGDTLDFARFLSATFVHVDFTHLSSNVAGFLLVGVFLFLLAKKCWVQRFLLASLFWVLFGLPLLYGVVVWFFSDVAFEGVLSGFGCGLSLVVGGLAGLILPLLVLLFYSELVSSENRWRLFLGLFLLAGSLMIFNYVGASVFYWMVFAGLFVGGFGFLAWSFCRVLGVSGRKINWTLKAKFVWFVFGLLLHIFCLVALFPAEIFMLGGRVNIFAHYFGVAFGAVVPQLGFSFVGDKSLN